MKIPLAATSRPVRIVCQGLNDPNEGFKPSRGVVIGMEELILDEDDEMLAPAVVVATIALIGVFVLGALYQIVGLLI